GADLEGVTSADSVSTTTQEPQPGQTPETHSIAEAATSQGLPEAFFCRFIWQESRFNPREISNAGAQGITQFMPGTAR
ncbi:MAG TPA: transglycosylase SLT domain-containing protein, partial [Povalibacter sp.]